LQSRWNTAFEKQNKEHQQETADLQNRWNSAFEKQAREHLEATSNQQNEHASELKQQEDNFMAQLRALQLRLAAQERANTDKMQGQ